MNILLENCRHVSTLWYFYITGYTVDNTAWSLKIWQTYFKFRSVKHLFDYWYFTARKTLCNFKGETIQYTVY